MAGGTPVSGSTRQTIALVQAYLDTVRLENRNYFESQRTHIRQVGRHDQVTSLPGSTFRPSGEAGHIGTPLVNLHEGGLH